MRSTRAFLLLYQSIVMLATATASAIFLLFTYDPDPNKLSGKIGTGGIILDCSWWSLLFTITGSLSFLNSYENIRKSSVTSFLMFYIGPVLLVLIVYILPTKAEDLFGFAETGSIFCIFQLFFFIRFRYFIKQNNGYNSRP